MNKTYKCQQCGHVHEFPRDDDWREFLRELQEIAYRLLSDGRVNDYETVYKAKERLRKQKITIKHYQEKEKQNAQGSHSRKEKSHDS